MRLFGGNPASGETEQSRLERQFFGLSRSVASSFSCLCGGIFKEAIIRKEGPAWPANRSAAGLTLAAFAPVTAVVWGPCGTAPGQKVAPHGKHQR